MNVYENGGSMFAKMLSCKHTYDSSGSLVKVSDCGKEECPTSENYKSKEKPKK